MNQKIKTSNTRSGSGLIFAVVLLFVILGMVVTLSSVTMLETKMNQKTKSSVGAFYNADSGVEWALNKISSSSGNIIAAFPEFAANKTPCPGAIGGASTCELYFLDEAGKVIANSGLDVSAIKAVRAVGSQGGETQRAIEAAVATGGGCYVSYKSGCSLSPKSSGCCDVGTVQGDLGGWGYCLRQVGSLFVSRPPSGSCDDTPPAVTGDGSTWDWTDTWISYGGNKNVGEAYLCCQ